jgi:transcriptional regulator with XRE-family HTH domain
VVESNISQHLSDGRRRSAATAPEWRRALGAELRHQRERRGLTQAAFGAPLTRAFVSAVERGRAVPSIPALEVMLARAEIPLSAFFARIEAQMVDQELTASYDPRHGSHRDQEAPTRRRRSA